MKFCNVEIPARLFDMARDHIRTRTCFTIADVRPHLLGSGRDELAACNSLERNWQLVANRVVRAVLSELEEAEEVHRIKRGVWARGTVLTNDESAIICTLHQEPKYRFLGSELRAARRMATAGYLKEGADKHFTVTPAGELAYAVRRRKAD